MGFLATLLYLQPEREKTKNVSIYQDDNLRTQVKIESPTGRAVLTLLVLALHTVRMREVRA